MSKKLKVKKGDTVVVIAGKDKAKSGKVIAAFPNQDKVMVEGLNIAQKHQKARSVKQQSGIIKKAIPIHVSNVMLLCGTCKEATRSKIKEEDGKKLRICRKCGAEFDK